VIEVAVGWETWFRVRAQVGGYSDDSFTDAYCLYLDSESMGIGQEIKENTGKIVFGRQLVKQARTFQARSPGGQFTFQPRSNDALGILCSVMQSYRSSADGTYVFNPISGQPDWSGINVTGGDPFGAGGTGTGTYGDTTNDVMALCIEQSLGAGVTGSNGRRWCDCVVSQLEINMAVGEEITFTPTIMAGSFAMTSFAVSEDPPCNSGSYSSLDSFQFYEGTVTLGTAAFSVTSCNLTINNGMNPRAVVGKRDPSKFTYGRQEVTGEFTLEYEDHVFLQHFLLETDTNITLKGANNSGLDYIQITMPLVRYNEPTLNVSDGESVIEHSIPFKAFSDATDVNSISPLEIEVVTTDTGVGGTTFFPDA
jgi:hypothetical protein